MRAQAVVVVASLKVQILLFSLFDFIIFYPLSIEVPFLHLLLRPVQCRCRQLCAILGSPTTRNWGSARDPLYPASSDWAPVAPQPLSPRPHTPLADNSTHCTAARLRMTRCPPLHKLAAGAHPRQCLVPWQHPLLLGSDHRRSRPVICARTPALAQGPSRVHPVRRPARLVDRRTGAQGEGAKVGAPWPGEQSRLVSARPGAR